MRVKVFGVLDYEGGVNDRGEGFVGEVSAGMEIRALILLDEDWGNIRLLSLESRERGLDLVVFVVFVLDVVVNAVDFLRPMLVRTPLPNARVA